MMRIGLVGITGALSFQMALAEDFKKSYSLEPGGQIFVENTLGNIKVQGFKGSSIEVVGTKENEEESNPIEILDHSFGNRIEIRLRPVRPHESKAKVNFEIRVPEATEYNFSRLSSFSGNVEISGINGRIRAESVRGNVTLKDVKGLVSTSSFSGNIKVELAKSPKRGNMMFSSISGNIDVSAPSDLDALIDISCASGMLKTDFPLEVQELRYGPGRSARGRLGSGMQILRIRSVSGRISLTQK